MSWINRIAFYRNIRNEIPNQELAREFARSNNSLGIHEIAGYLFDKNPSVASDCIKVIYETGYIKPELIQEYTDIFLQLLESKNNRMVWGGMIALSTVAYLRAEQIFNKIDLVLETIKKGTLITEVSGIKTIAIISTVSNTYKEKLLPALFDYLEKCRPIDFASRVETTIPVISSSEEKEILNSVIKLKSNELSCAQIRKLNTVLNKYNKLKEKK